MKTIKLLILLFSLAALFLLESCNWEENDLILRESTENGIVYNKKNISLASTTVYQLSAAGDSSHTFKFVATDMPFDEDESDQDSPLNALFIELSTASEDGIAEGAYYFQSGKPGNNTKGITYGMALLDGQQAIGIVGGSVEVRKENGAYNLRFDLLSETEERITGELLFPLQEETEEKKSRNSNSMTACPSCNDNFNRWVSEVEARAWAARFAPYVKFDQAASTFPDDVESIWNASSNKECGQRLVLSDRSIIENRNLNFTTYFDVQISPNDERRVFIDYWWVYARQPNCIGNTGGHDYDWEHVVIQFNRNNWNRSTITFFQHAGWYTLNLTEDRDEVYVGKVAHGSYHDSGGMGGCLYYADYRNPGLTVDIANRLYQLRCSNLALGSSVDWGSPGKGPLRRSRDYWNYAPCKGNSLFGTNGCARGDYKDTSLGNIVRGFQ